ncbi:MAG: SHOCT domain-containing protein [Nocardioidaceae bacterium]
MLTLASPRLVAHAHADGYDCGGWWPIIPIAWLLIVAGVITTIVMLSRRRWRMAGSQAGESRLSELYAAGEITEEEYRQRLAVLKEQRR